MNWKIYYHSPDSPEYYWTRSDEEVSAEDAPEYGVLCIVQFYSDHSNKDVIMGSDYYAIDEEGRWTGMNADGLEDRKKNNIPFSALKVGRQINTERFLRILMFARRDTDFGTKPKRN